MLIQPSKAVRTRSPIRKDLSLSRATLTHLNIERLKGTLSYLILVFFGFLTVFLVNKDIAVYQEILKIIIIFGGGLGSGFGLKGYLDRKNK
ncbi:MAG: hypothetical protein ACM65L_09970 [Microcoleus sp.]